ncbi:hypothetical protein D9757_012471 [Collybiopsis confluens]|uniref:Uncharacterized protein n=1 Tax=Collybiopsis confluens TaxID=2823264 RepID=A0A8H5G191_9AGAR|nr:hypothetical protein D9757_012471 [Collybiopsis confluens]
MFFAKTVVALIAAATVAVANPVTRQDGESTTCFFIMTPTPDLGATALQTDNNFAIGHTIGVEFPNTVFDIQNDPIIRHDDGTYDVETILSVTGQTAADVGAFVESWAHTTLDGIQAKWFVNAADCV